MERNYLKRQLSLRLVIYTAIAILLYGAATQYNTVLHGLYDKEKQPVNALILLQPPVFIAYNPQFKKAIVNNIPEDKNGYNAQDIIKKANITKDNFIQIDLPQQSRAEFWKNFNYMLRNWRKKPYLIFKYFYNFCELKYKKATDLSFGDFIILSLELAKLQSSDFAVQNPIAEKIKKGKKQKAAPITITTEIKPNLNARGPLVIEVLNASGQNGLAGKVTKYLREKTNQNIINVDVINEATYKELLDKTRIIDHNSRLLEIKATAYQLGLDNLEISSQEDKNAISDVKIILGKDFVLPKQAK